MQELLLLHVVSTVHMFEPRMYPEKQLAHWAVTWSRETQLAGTG